MASCGAPIDRTDGSNNIGICAAPANVAAHPFSNFVIGKLYGRLRRSRRSYRTGVPGPYFFKHRHGGTDLPRRAVAALESIVLNEGLLHGMELLASRQSF